MSDESTLKMLQQAIPAISPGNRPKFIIVNTEKAREIICMLSKQIPYIDLVRQRPRFMSAKNYKSIDAEDFSLMFEWSQKSCKGKPPYDAPLFPGKVVERHF